jgi:pyruvate formate lyase activating enzyme
MYPPIKGFIENTLLDWEGALASVVFLPGCNFRCGYCHAAHLMESGAGHESIPVESVLLNLRRQRGWVDGVVVSGGEPTLHRNLIHLLSAFKAEGVGVKLDTNGSRPEVLLQVMELGLVDYIAMDLKAPLDERYEKVAGAPVDLDAIRGSIALLLSGEVPGEFRTTVCPRMTSGDDVEEMAQTIQGASRYYLQPFRPLYCLDRSLEAVKPYTPDEMRDLCRRAAPYVERCMVRGDQASELVAGRADGTPALP